MFGVNVLSRSILCWLVLSCQYAFVLSSYQETDVQVADDVFLHVLEYGDSSQSDKVVLLVHGFPDLSLSWQYQAEKFAEQGYLVVTPDLRGFGSSSMPTEIVAYGRQQMVSDMDALRKHYCGENGSFAMIAGHDWGGSIVWATLDAFGNHASKSAPVIAKSAIILNAPHSRVFFAFMNKPKQAIKSWYMAFFQIPWLPEVFLYETKALYHLVSLYHKPMRSIPKESLPPSMDIDRNMHVYKKVLTDYDRIHAMLSLYRGAKSGIWRDVGDTSKLSLVERLVQWIHGIEFDVMKHQESCRASEGDGDGDDDGGIRITIPTLVLWGEHDVALSKELASPPADIVENLEGVEFFDADHFVHWDKPVEITERMIRFANAHNHGDEGSMVNEE